jgi:hypothetical protein
MGVIGDVPSYAVADRAPTLSRVGTYALNASRRPRSFARSSSRSSSSGDVMILVGLARRAPRWR